MMSIFGESKKLGRFIAPDGIECSPCFIRTITSETERRQQLSVKLHCSLKVFHSQINVIQDSCFHFSSIPSPHPLPEGEEDAKRQVRVILTFGLPAESSTSIPTRFHR